MAAGLPGDTNGMTQQMNAGERQKARAVAFIPARSGSERIRHKNIRRLGAHPLIAYSIASARDSGVFDAVVFCTDSQEYAEIARHYGAEVPFLRPTEISGPTSPDIEWIRFALDALAKAGRQYDCFSILRPTSPLRQAETIRRAWSAFIAEEGVDSLRAVEKCQQHPGKMWVIRGSRMYPILPYRFDDVPWHSSQYKALPEIYVQNASLEIAWTRVAQEGGSIAGDSIMPFVSEGYEGADVNAPMDWNLIEALIGEGTVSLPPVASEPFPASPLIDD